MSDTERLDNILKDIHEHGGAITLWPDMVWLQSIQSDMPDWAKPVFEKYAKLPHIHDELIRRGAY